MNGYPHAWRDASRSGFFIVTLAAGAWLLASPAGAQENGPTIENGCMQTVFGTPVANSNKLNCTANDIRLSRAISVSPDTCISGSTFDLEATFEVAVTANARYDAGFFFRTDGGPNARGDGVNATGQCSLSALTPPPPPNAPALELDGDSCGDLNAGTFEVTFVIPDVSCVAAPGTNQLRLPNCTSWHSNQRTVCEISEPEFLASDADFFHPDTKSKCVCDDTFTVPVTVEDAELIVTKTANPTQIPEPGGTVSFTVEVENAAAFESVVIKSIIDVPYGDVGLNTPGYSPNNCPDLIDTTLGPGGTAMCSFSVPLSGNAGDSLEDTVTVTATQPSTGNDIDDSDDAVVDVTDVFTEPTVSKDAQATANCSVDATYEVVVSNNSEFDTLDVNSLTDDKFGDIATVHDAGGGIAEVVSTTCNSVANPFGTIGPSGSYTCGFVGRITSSDCAIDHTNEVTADVTDDDGVDSMPTDTALVTVTATP